MSSRQRARIANNNKSINKLINNKLDINNNNNNEESDSNSDNDEEIPNKQSNIMKLSSLMSDSDNTSSSDSDNDQIISIISNKTSKTKNTKIITEEDDYILIDKAIEENIQQSNQIDIKNIINNKYINIFKIQLKEFDIDSLLHSRFGNINDFNNNNNLIDLNDKRKKNNRSIQRRFIFGQPNDDWYKAIHYISGGLTIKKIKQTNYNNIDYKIFQFELSNEYIKVNNIYDIIENSNDPNVIVMFLSNYPYYVKGLYQLSNVLTKTGNINISIDLIRRCLYYIEYACIDSFKPYNGDCLLSNHSDNIIIYECLYKYMQLAYLIGCPSISSSIGRYILSLNPFDDTMGILLILDFYLIQSCKYILIYELMGLDINNNLSSNEIYELIHESIENNWKNAFVLSKNSLDDLLDDSVDNQIDNEVTIGVLPNWLFSLSIAIYYNKNLLPNELINQPNKYSINDIANYLLEQTIIQYPIFIQILYDKMTDSQIYKQKLEKIQKLPYFFNIEKQCFQLPDYQNIFLYKYLILYVNLSINLWKREELFDWLIRCCERINSFYFNQTSDNLTNNKLINSYVRISSYPQISKYNDCKYLTIEHFSEDIIRFPNDMNPLNRELQDPRPYLTGERKFDLSNIINSLINNDYIYQINQQLGNGPINQIDQQIDHPGNLDPNLPLLQLFIQTLFPWNRVYIPANQLQEYERRNFNNP